MAVREILKMGDARLLRVAQPVRAFDTPELHALLKDMQDTMQAANGAGLAAPQIGEDLQVVIFGSGQINPRYPDAPPVPRTVLINPVITPLVTPLVSSDGASGFEQKFQENHPPSHIGRARSAIESVAFDLQFQASKQAFPCPDCVAWCHASKASVIKALTSWANRLTAQWMVSTQGSCNTNATTCTAFCIRCA
jgi:hypothetical protein